MDERSYDIQDASNNHESLKCPRFSVPIIVFLAIGGVFLLMFGLARAEIDIGLLVLVLVFSFLFIVLGICTKSLSRGAPSGSAHDDEQIFYEMHMRASRALPAEGIDWFRCSECMEAFEKTNARQVDDLIALCPFCGTRLLMNGQDL